MNIRKVLSRINILNNFQNWNLEIEDIVYDSRKIKKNCIFVCLVGKNIDGHKFAKDAIQKGAVAVVCEKNINFENQIIVDNSRKSLSRISSNFFENDKNDELTLIGITGTKGKTTSSSFVCKVLNDYGIRTCQIGTMGAIFGSERIETKNTTPESYEVHKFLRKAKNENFKALVIEASSIGLKEFRLDNILFDYGVFTNISNDHISKDEHEDLDDYIKSKSLLFKRCKVGIANCDDEKFNEVIKNHSCDIVTYGFGNNADIRCEKFYFDEKSLKSKFYVNNEEYFLSIPGKFNIYNALSCISVCKRMNIPYENIRYSLEKCKVKGRVEVVFKNENFMVIIDYAHNETSLKNILISLRSYNPKRLITLFGAGGNRPRVRRYSMGKVSGEYSDLSVISSDNSRFEDVYDIIDDIKKGILETNGKFIVIPDRREAIFYCLKNAQKGDIIVLAGKGHETYQEINGVSYHFDEREIVNDILHSIGVSL